MQPSCPRKLSVESTAYYYIELADGGAKRPAPALIGIHGYAQTGPEFVGLMRKIAPTRFAAVAPQGLNQLPVRTSGRVAFHWMSSFEKADSIERNGLFLKLMIESLAKDGTIDPTRVYLLGFSQGASVAFRFAQRHPELVRGVISACSDLPPDVAADLSPFDSIPALIIYSNSDPIVPGKVSEIAYSQLREAGVAVEALTFAEGHKIPSSIHSDIRDWMERIESRG